jgi:phage terminase small subunit
MTNQEQAQRDYESGMKYKDIAGKYGVSVNTVKSWQRRRGWSRGQEKRVHPLEARMHWETLAVHR